MTFTFSIRGSPLPAHPSLPDPARPPPPASRAGDVDALRSMLTQGMRSGSADYDGRTGLMLAAGGGHEAACRLLLDGGAKTNQVGLVDSSKKGQRAPASSGWFHTHAIATGQGHLQQAANHLKCWAGWYRLGRARQRGQQR